MQTNLDLIFNPHAVAVIGASTDPLKWGNLMSKGLIEGGYKGKIFLINPKGGVIYNHETYKSIFDFEDEIDLAVIGIPAKFVPDSVRDLLQKGVKGIIIVTAGFGETGSEGKKVEEMIVELARRRGTRIMGPNCLGFYNSSLNLNTTILSFTKAPIAFLTQSGNFGLEINYLAKKRALGFTKFISVGNQADILFHEYLEYVNRDQDTKVVLLYVEGLKNGREFFRIAKETTRNKPIIALKVGVTPAGRRSAASHTSSLAGSDEIYSAAFNQAGVIRVSNSIQLLDLGQALAKCPLPRGNKIAILADGGGHATIGADAAESLNLEVPIFSKETQDKLGKILPMQASKKNPVDFAGAAEADLWNFVKCSEVILQDKEIDGLLIVGQYGGYQDVFPEYGNLEETISEKIADLVIKYAKPIICHTMYLADKPKSLDILSSRGVPVYSNVETAMRCMSALVEYRGHLNKVEEEEKESPLILPADRITKVKQTIDMVRKDGRINLVETEARKILCAYGMPMSHFKLARSEAEATKSAEEIGYPVAMKIVSPEIIHKSDVGGVKLNIRNKDELKTRYAEIINSVRRFNKEANIVGVTIAPMEEKGIETIIGMTTDETFGPTIMFGLGGVFVEVLKDVCFKVAPVTEGEAYDMIKGIKGYLILKGVRGQKPADIEALVDAIRRVSALVAENPEIREIDLNPFFAFEKGGSVVDVRMVLSARVEGRG